MPLNTLFITMKHILTLVAAATVLGFAAPTTSNAWEPGYQTGHGNCGHSRIVSYLPCGRPVYAVYQIIGRDRCGTPLGRWVTQRPSCGCGTCNPRPTVCPPPGYHGSHFRGHPLPPHHRSGASWSFSFGG